MQQKKSLKSKKLSGAKGRLLEYLDYKGIKKADFYRATSLGNGFLDKNDNIGSDNIEIIVSKFPDLNLSWLVTGNGEMLSKSDEGCVLTQTFLEKISSSFEKSNEGMLAIIGQNGEVIKINADIVKQNSELIRQHAEAMQVIQKLSEKLL